MFCMQCGKELPNEARFCSHCGTAQSASSGDNRLSFSDADTIEPDDWTVLQNNRGYSLRGLYTLDWSGTCPSCKLVHSPENLSCLNDRTPMVVAFDEWPYVLKRYPVHAATLRCLADCGLHTMAFPCTRCGAAVAGKNIVFRFGVLPRLTHLMFQTGFVILFFVLLGATIGVNPLFALPLLMTFRVVKHFRPFGRFNFAAVPPAARKYAKEVAEKDAIKTAKVLAVNRGFFRAFLDK